MLQGTSTRKIVIGCVAVTFVMPLLLCVTWIWIYPKVMTFYYREDIAEIERRYLEFDELLKQGEYEDAYQYMSPTYRRMNSYRDFWTGANFFIRGGWEVMHPNREIWVRGNRGTIFPGDGRKLFAVGIEYELIRENGEWYFTGESVWYTD